MWFDRNGVGGGVDKGIWPNTLHVGNEYVQKDKQGVGQIRLYNISSVTLEHSDYNNY